MPSKANVVPVFIVRVAEWKDTNVPSMQGGVPLTVRYVANNRATADAQAHATGLPSIVDSSSTT